MLKTGEKILGYEVRQVQALPEINAVFHRLAHVKTGARHIHIQRDDPENTFAVAFKTVPTDSTGVAHILEHTVLCGSQKFPVRDPFFAMLKRSLSTFMNAFTSSDWTLYPFSTQNRKDYYNLMNVYLDAAFFPRIDPLSFQQEGHRLELVSDSSGRPELVYKGIVYNEMKGAMSSPDQVMVRGMMNALYPETTYRFNSGGDPAEIPALTHSQLKTFHQRHYHPSNAYFYTYGNFELSDSLAYIEEAILTRFQPIDPETHVLSQPRWKSSREKTYTYALAESEDPKRKCQACVAWLTADIKDSFEVLVLKLLEQILLGNSASPLRKALIDSGLGTALSDGTGFDADNRDTMFSCGLKGTAEDSGEKIQGIIFSVLQELVDKEVDPEMIESAIHQIEFHRKEITNSPYPYGLRLLLTLTGAWFHGGEPQKVLQLDADLQKLREELEKGRFFENRIESYFLKNQHRVLLTLLPDQQKAEREKAQEAEKLKAVQQGLSPEDLQELQENAARLKRLQEAPEDVSCLPTLARSDIPPAIQITKPRENPEDLPVVCYDQPTSGIFYFSGVAGIGALPERLLPLVPFFCSALPRMGTRKRHYTELVRWIDRYTGGIGLGAQARTRYNESGDCLPFISLNGKCLLRNIHKMFDITSELFTEFSFADHTRLKTLLLEYQAGLESAVIQNGHRHCMMLAARNFSMAAALNETWYGVHQLKAVKEWTGAINSNKGEELLQGLAADLNRIGEILFQRGNLKLALVGESAALGQALAPAKRIYENVGAADGNGYCEPQLILPGEVPHEGWSTATAVSFVARTLPTIRMGHADAPALSVLSKIMRSMYLHREIREKGGAYGGYALYNPESGLFSFASYRDPHILETVAAFDGAARFVCSGAFQAEDVKEAILQVCSEIDKPDTPAGAAKKAFQRGIVGLTDEGRLEFKKGLLALEKDQIVATAQKYFSRSLGDQALVVIASEEKLKSVHEKGSIKDLMLYRI